nr:hypothetical protein [uncultured Hyphomonas sp.]
MKSSDLILLAPAIAFAGGLTGLIKHTSYPDDVLYLATSIFLFIVGVAAFGALLLLVRASLHDSLHENEDS